MAKKAKGAKEEGCQEAVALRMPLGVPGWSTPFFLAPYHLSKLLLSRDAPRDREEPAKRDGQRPGRRARRQSAPGRRANGSQSTTTERGDYRWRRRLKAARRRRRRSVNFRRFRHKGDVHGLCVPFFYCLNAGSGGGVSPSQIVTLRTTSHGPRRSTTSMPVHHMAEHRIAAVEVRLRGMGDEELAAAGVGPVERHADRATQVRPHIDLVADAVAGAPFTVAPRVPVLHHEIRNDRGGSPPRRRIPCAPAR